LADGPSPAQLSRVLRYHLNELGALNAHHDFEHLTRHVARARLYSNILPATGPVSAGGDGGRDFESFRTNLPLPLTANSPFVAQASGAREVVFACSLEKRIEPKIKKDVKSIVAGGAVDEIVYFCEADFPIGRRRRLQKWARDEHNIELRIFDGQAIAEWLADRDLFWIAQQYLSLPAETGPAGPASGDGYDDRLARWRDREPLVISQADFTDIKRGVRRATFDIEARHDLRFWISKMEVFAAHEAAPRGLARNAAYEIAVASLRGFGDLNPQAHRLRDYYSDVGEWTGQADLQNAATLLVYAHGGLLHSTYHGSLEELVAWRNTLLDVIDREIETAPGPVRRTGLLRVRGHISGLPSAPDAPSDPDASRSDWGRMLDEAKSTPLFPIEDFSDFLTKVIAITGEDAELLALAERADELIAERAGGAVAGEKALRRALALLDNDHPLTAIRELHKAKAKWFSGDRIEGAVRVMLLLAGCYRDLGLTYAAKNYALAAAFIAEYHPDDALGPLLPTARLSVADFEDNSGCAVGFLQAMAAMLHAHVQHEADPLNLQKHSDLNVNIGQLTTWRGALLRLAPEALPTFDRLYADWPPVLWDPIRSASESADGFWMQDNPDELWERLQEAFLDRPFSDFGPKRTVRWRAMDIDWTCVFENRYAVVPEAEQVIASLQLFAVILLRVDLVTLPGEVHIDVRVDPTRAEPAFEEVEPSTPTTIRTFSLTLPSGGPLDPWPMIQGVLAPILGALSLLPPTEAAEALSDQMEALAGELFTARPYPELYRDLISEEAFGEAIRQALPAIEPERVFELRKIEALSGPTGPGPGYDADEAAVSIEQRYDRSFAYLRHTLPVILADPDVRARLAAMRDEGLKDWEILSILANIALNARFSFDVVGRPSREVMEKAKAELSRPEEPDEALSAEAFSEEAIRVNRLMFIGAHVGSWGLQGGRMRDPDALEALLIRRYGLRRDDVDHEPLF